MYVGLEVDQRRSGMAHRSHLNRPMEMVRLSLVLT